MGRRELRNYLAVAAYLDTYATPTTPPPDALLHQVRWAYDLALARKELALRLVPMARGQGLQAAATYWRHHADGMAALASTCADRMVDACTDATVPVPVPVPQGPPGPPQAPQAPMQGPALQHTATARQWAYLEELRGNGLPGVLLELRSRVHALEQQLATLQRP